MDPRRLNQALKRQHYLIPNIRDLVTTVGKSKYFSVLDLRWGFWQLRLDADITRLCTFATPFGRFSFKPLLFGISPTPEIFRRIVSEALYGLAGVTSYMNDILIHADTMEDHDKRLQAVIARLQKHGFILNTEKCVLGKKKVKFLGYYIRQSKVTPNPVKVSALESLPAPKSNKDLCSLLGKLTYMGEFVPGFSMLLEPLQCPRTLPGNGQQNRKNSYASSFDISCHPLLLLSLIKRNKRHSPRMPPTRALQLSSCKKENRCRTVLVPSPRPNRIIQQLR